MIILEKAIEMYFVPIVFEPKIYICCRSDYCVIFRWFHLLNFHTNRRARLGLEKVNFLINAVPKSNVGEAEGWKPEIKHINFHALILKKKLEKTVKINSVFKIIKSQIKNVLRIKSEIFRQTVNIIVQFDISYEKYLRALSIISYKL